jgi:hypothetical protein
MQKSSAMKFHGRFPITRGVQIRWLFKGRRLFVARKRKCPNGWAIAGFLAIGRR